ncbi:MAG TPA: FYDLN acid domain-containing protein [Thermoanaerobaculia bacterium]|nr:FYDLN acid domain-containing protein [Thermoanaerobaculia bacterium]
MPQLGRKYTCYSCHTKFYDLGKPEPICPKCGADQRDAEDAPVVPTSRGRRAAPVPVVEPVEEPEFGVEAEGDDAEVEEEILDEREEEVEEEEEEEEY